MQKKGKQKMDKIKMLGKIKGTYMENKNIIKYLKEIDGRSDNSIEDIMISYDFQTGSYTQAYKDKPKSKEDFCFYLANIINDLGSCDSIVEVDEGTTLGLLLKRIKNEI
jgi:hypothetical protein